MGNKMGSGSARLIQEAQRQECEDVLGILQTMARYWDSPDVAKFAGDVSAVLEARYPDMESGEPLSFAEELGIALGKMFPGGEKLVEDLEPRKIELKGRSPTKKLNPQRKGGK